MILSYCYTIILLYCHTVIHDAISTSRRLLDVVVFAASFVRYGRRCSVVGYYCCRARNARSETKFRRNTHNRRPNGL